MVQIYCLMYRCCVMLASKSVYNIFMSIPFIGFMWVFGHMIAIPIGYGFYSFLVRPEVCSIKFST